MLSTIKPAAALLAVTLAAALALGFVFEITKEPIARQKAKTEAETVALLLPGTERTEALDVDDTTVTRVITCYAGGNVNGYAVCATTKGYGGAVDIMVGYGIDGIIKGFKLLSHSETPGLGANAALPGFTEQFTGKSGRLTVVKAKSAAPDQVEAVTSATITSDAVTQGVNAATDYFQLHLR